MSTESITLMLAVLGVASGVTGAVLGILNTWRNIRRDRVRLHVQVTWAMVALPPNGIRTNLQIRVVNLSEFPIAITDVGFKLKGKYANLARVPSIEPKGPLPKTLEPRRTYEKVLGIDELYGFASDIRRAYASTECGVIAYSKQRGLQTLISQVSDAAHRERMRCGREE